MPAMTDPWKMDTWQTELMIHARFDFHPATTSARSARLIVARTEQHGAPRHFSVFSQTFNPPRSPSGLHW